MNNLWNLARFLLLVMVSLLLISCETVQFYGQAVRGQLSILTSRQDIEQLISAPDTDPGLVRKLELVLQAREFANTELLLPAVDSFTSYSDVDRQHVVWNVFAAPEFSLSPVNWCYPVAGCVAYRGYFSESGAIRFARNLESEGFDVYVGGVDAYSTLGWFADPLLSTVMNRDDAQLAGLVFHELAHQKLYVPGDTTFNESFATLVEREGVARWLQATGVVEDREVEAQANRQEEFVALVLSFRERFEALYESGADEERMRQAKASLQSELRGQYGQLKLAWGGYPGYDNWFSAELNNAQLSTVNSYNDLVPAMRTLLENMAGSLPEWFDEMQRLAGLPRDERDAFFDSVQVANMR